MVVGSRESVHLDQQLCFHASGSLVLLFARPAPHERVYFVHKNGAGRQVPSHLEQNLRKKTKKYTTKGNKYSMLELLTGVIVTKFFFYCYKRIF